LKEIAKYDEESGENSDAFEEEFHTCTLNSQIRQLVTKVQPVLAQCRGIRRWQLLLQKFLGHPCIKPSLPAYYLPPKEVAAQQLLIEGIKMDLHGVKGVQSRDKLAWKGALMSVAVRKSSVDYAKS
jgi:hypothetical protein